MIALDIGGSPIAVAAAHGAAIGPHREQVLLNLLLGMVVIDLLPPSDAIERRLSDIEFAGIDELRHVAIEERQEQGADMRTIHVRVGHDDDLAIANAGEVHLVRADAGPHGGEQVADLLVPENLVEARLLHIQDFPLERQDRLENAVAPLLC